jgi:hypothetical protein
LQGLVVLVLSHYDEKRRRGEERKEGGGGGRRRRRGGEHLMTRVRWRIVRRAETAAAGVSGGRLSERIST